MRLRIVVSGGSSSNSSESSSMQWQNRRFAAESREGHRSSICHLSAPFPISNLDLSIVRTLVTSAAQCLLPVVQTTCDAYLVLQTESEILSWIICRVERISHSEPKNKAIAVMLQLVECSNVCTHPSHISSSLR